MAKPIKKKVVKDFTQSVSDYASIIFHPETDMFVIQAGGKKGSGSIETLIDTPGVSLNMNQFNTLVHEGIKLGLSVGDGDIVDD